MVSALQTDHLQDCNTILIGDFNVDFMTQTSQQTSLKKIAEEHSYHQHISEPTTDYISTLDLIFSNCTAQMYRLVCSKCTFLTTRLSGSGYNLYG
ncbi:hypothetical protein DPMN_054525 [Dreissena polymorpha]|uniref:Endonuclease/exonuclease/phosphatase domain-containing protein n=1 Tax=Dreissena polymorpha TaxID=45954 RepID=A0A9D4CP18_DREPO|nr:hypothetical protein DPMN_054525 [Dreissena polymorpha]